MKIYLASRYSRREEMVSIAMELSSWGHVVSSRWVWGSHGVDNGDQRRWEEFAIDDMDDLEEADALIVFTEESRTSTRGGRHVEYGMALAWDLPTIIVGPVETVFHTLVPRRDTWQEALEVLEKVGIDYEVTMGLAKGIWGGNT